MFSRTEWKSLQVDELRTNGMMLQVTVEYFLIAFFLLEFQGWWSFCRAELCFTSHVVRNNWYSCKCLLLNICQYMSQNLISSQTFQSKLYIEIPRAPRNFLTIPAFDNIFALCVWNAVHVGSNVPHEFEIAIKPRMIKSQTGVFKQNLFKVGASLVHWYSTS